MKHQVRDTSSIIQTAENSARHKSSEYPSYVSSNCEEKVNSSILTKKQKPDHQNHDDLLNMEVFIPHTMLILVDLFMKGNV